MQTPSADEADEAKQPKALQEMLQSTKCSMEHGTIFSTSSYGCPKTSANWTLICSNLRELILKITWVVVFTVSVFCNGEDADMWPVFIWHLMHLVEVSNKNTCEIITYCCHCFALAFILFLWKLEYIDFLKKHTDPQLSI